MSIPIECSRCFRARLILLGLAGGIGLAGCGYQSGDSVGSYEWKSLYRDDVATVAVPIFTNKSFRRGDELMLTKALVTQIEARTPYKVVSRDKADTIIEGEITDVSLNTVSNDGATGLPQEQLYGVTVTFRWKDLRSGRILVERRGFAQTSAFYPLLGEGTTLGSQQANEQLAIAIAQELQADW